MSEPPQLTMDDLIREVSKLAELKRNYEYIQAELHRQRGINYALQNITGEWNVLTLMGSVNWVNQKHTAFSLEIGRVDYTFELAEGEEWLAEEDIVMVVGNIYAVGQGDAVDRVLVKAFSVTLISSPNEEADHE